MLIECGQVVEVEFGYQGSRKEKDIPFDNYHTLFRSLDAELGRWRGVDPKINPSLSGYVSMANNPLRYNDPLGDTIRWLDRSGNILMLLDDGKQAMVDRRTVRESDNEALGVFDLGIQRFEPEADNYMKPLWINPDIANFSGIKHFSWDDIVDYADRHQSLWGYAWNGAWNDWKSHVEGAANHFLVTVGGQPYWADAIGQIPYAINQTRSNLLNGFSMERAVRATVAAGRRYGGGLFGASDNSSSYDNFMILRGALFAVERFSVEKTPVTRVMEHGITINTFDFRVKAKSINTSILRYSIDHKTATKYGYE